MAKEIRAATVTGKTLYSNIMNTSGKRWNGSSFETYSSANYSTYKVILTEQGTSGVYVADFPTAITTDGTYDYFVYLQGGSSAIEGDIVVNTGQTVWKSSVSIASTYTDTSSELRAVGYTGDTVYGHIMNSSGQRWNGSAFEDYTGSNYANYDISMTEQGSSGVFLGTFPSGLDGATYEFFCYRQLGASPATGDPVIGTGKILWNGSSITYSDVVGMSAIEMRDYIVRTFKRDDKDVELYEALTDTIRDMRSQFNFSEDEIETSTTDTISTLGDYKISMQSNFGLLVGGVRVIDGDDSMDLTPISKPEFDRFYPNPSASTVTKAKPIHYTLFGGIIYLGPVPDSTSYTYRLSFSIEPFLTIDADTVSVPFTRYYRETVKYGVLARLYGAILPDMASFYDQKYMQSFGNAIKRERHNNYVQVQVRYSGI